VTFPGPPAAARAALDRPIASDPHLAEIEARAGPLSWRSRASGFPGLLQAIMTQQIRYRLHAIGGAPVSAGMLALSDGVLRAAGLTRRGRDIPWSIGRATPTAVGVAHAALRFEAAMRGFQRQYRDRRGRNGSRNFTRRLL
jgi:hypothetical protein